MKAAVLALAMLALPASADVMVATGSGTNSLRLYSTPCTHAGTLERLKPEYHSLFKQAQADMGGKVLDGCHIHIPEHEVYFVLLDGADGFALSADAFKLERGV